MSLPWIKVHKELPRHPKAHALDLVLGRRRAWTHVLELWLYAAELRPDGNLAGLPAGVIARGAGWRGNAQRFVEGLRETGFLDGDVLHDWEEHQPLHVELAVAAAGTAEDKVARRRAADRERKSAKRSAAKADMSAVSAPVRTTSAVSADVSAGRSGHDADSLRTNPVSDSPPARAETETETETKSETNGEEQKHVPLRDETGPNPSQDAKSSDALEAVVTDVLEAWRTAAEKPGAAIDGKAAVKRRARIKARVAEGWTRERLLRVVLGMTRSDWLMGRDPKARPGGWRDVDTVFRDNAKCEELFALATEPAPPRAVAGRVAYDPHADDGLQTSTRVGV